MWRVLAVALLYSSLAGLSLPASPHRSSLLDRRDLRDTRDPQEPSFRSSSSDLVVLPVVVTERADQYVSDLAKDAFTVYDNGRPVTIDFFSNEDTPVTVGLVIDSSSSMRHKLGDVIAASTAFARSSNPDDELFAVWFNDEVRDALPDRAFLPAGDLSSFSRVLASLVPEGRTSLYDALVASIDRASRGSRSRKVLVLVSDGGDNASAATLDHVLSRARTSNVAIYTIGIFDDMDPDKNPGVLKSIANATGGERHLPRTPGKLLQACQHVAREIRGGYTIGYVPPDRDGAYHRVRVDVTSGKRKLNVRTRPGYIAAATSPR